MNLEDKKESKNTRKSLEALSSEKLWKCVFSVAKKMTRKIFINVKRWNYIIVLRMPQKISTIST